MKSNEMNKVLMKWRNIENNENDNNNGNNNNEEMAK